MGDAAACARREGSAGARRLLRTAWAVPLALSLSCADMPTAPRALVSVSGTILDRDGAALAGIRLFFQPADSLPGFARYGVSAFTDAAGRYTTSLPAATYSVGIEPPPLGGYPIVWIPSWTASLGAATLDYRYQGVRVSGTVTGPDGQPLGDVEATLQSTTAALAVEEGPVVGRYSLLAPAGAYVLFVGPRHYFNDVGVPDFRIPLPPLTADTTVDVSLTGYKVDMTATVNGTIPLANAVVFAWSPDASTTARSTLNGTVTLYLPSASYSVEIEPETGNVVAPDAFYLIVRGNQSATVDVPSVHWSGTLRRAADGSAIGNAEVDIRESARYSAAGAYDRTDATGHFEFWVRPSRPYDLLTDLPASSGYSYVRLANGVFSAADSTFDLYVDEPAP